MSNSIQLSEGSKSLFTSLVEDAPNWSGQPLVDVDGQDKGHLTDLKRKGLVKTVTDEGDTFAYFTQKGAQYAQELGLHTDELDVV